MQHLKYYRWQRAPLKKTVRLNLKWDAMPSPPVIDPLKVNGPVYVWSTGSLPYVGGNAAGLSTEKVNYITSGNRALHFLLVDI